MNFKLFTFALSAICCVAFAIKWYNGEMVEAWIALVWCAGVALNELSEYLEK